MRLSFYKIYKGSAITFYQLFKDGVMEITMDWMFFMQMNKYVCRKAKY